MSANYSPAEICEMFGISKSTLFRWEDDSVIPQVGRDLNGQRIYTWAHIQAISEKKIGDMRKLFVLANSSDDDLRVGELLQALSLRKFMAGDNTGLSELTEGPPLSPEIVKLLLRIAINEYEFGDDTFLHIIETIYLHCKKIMINKGEKGQDVGSPPTS